MKSRAKSECAELTFEGGAVLRIVAARCMPRIVPTIQRRQRAGLQRIDIQVDVAFDFLKPSLREGFVCGRRGGQFENTLGTERHPLLRPVRFKRQTRASQLGRDLAINLKMALGNVQDRTV